MSGDVQPRKRKDKKKKKDDLGIEEPRGTAAALGEGDIFMHSHHEHGTGGHWCAKVIFFSLLAVLVTLIGLIILENRGLSELEANSVESRYSGVLEGWLEDAHDGDHHDEHTLELNHHDDEEDDDDDHGGGIDHDEDHDDEHDDDDDNEEDEENGHDDDEEDENHDDENQEDDEEDDDEQDNVDDEENDEDAQDANDDNAENEDSEEQDLETAEDEDEVEESNYRRYYQSSKSQPKDEDDDDDDDDDNDNDDLRQVDDNDDDDQSAQDDEDNQQDNEPTDDSQENDEDDEQGQLDTNEDDNDNSNENDQDNEGEDAHEDHEKEDDVEVEHIEEEVFDDDVSTEAPASAAEDKSEEASNEFNNVDDADEDEVEFLEPDDSDELPEELPIPLPKGKPLAEVEDSTSTERPQDSLADEEEYERQQEALRKEKEQASQGMWLKLVVGGALLVATQAVLRRATAPRETEEDVDTTREETPLSDRRMTLISEPVPPPPVTPIPQEVVQKEVVRQAPVVHSAPPPEEDEEEVEEEEEENFVTEVVKPVTAKKEIDKELYSDEEEAEDEEEIVVEKKEAPTVSKPSAPIKEPPKPAPVKETPKPVEKKALTLVEKEPLMLVEKEPTPEEEDDDVEIIEDEELGEELEEEEEDISDVDDAELLTRLEAKYGRLPEPERPGRKKDGGNSIEDWPGEPSDSHWRDELDQAERDLRQGEWTTARWRASKKELRWSARAWYIVARAYDSAAEAKRDNLMLTQAITAYFEVLKMNERLPDAKLLEVADRTLDRIKFRGHYLKAEPVYRLLIRRFPDNTTHRNNLAISFLMANKLELAEEVIKETLMLWPDDRIALAHYGYILKTLHNRFEEAVDAFTKALDGDTGPATADSRFYYNLGDSLLLLGRPKEAHEVHKRGAKLGHFLSPAQRSLYNVARLKSQPWWDVEKTPYAPLARALETSWEEILKEGQEAQWLYEKEKEGLKERGEWSQLDLFVQGRELPKGCSRAPVTCRIVRSEVAARGCRRGQVKFSSMGAGTHVRAHVGPTNCRLRMHLGLSNTKDTYIRVDQEIRQWQTGKVLMFDDSFEHEVWHNGTGTRLVLIVDVWHPDLTQNERRQLPAI